VRRTIARQSDLFPFPSGDHELARELAEIDAILRGHPEWADWVHRDLTILQGVSSRKGRAGMPGWQVVRVVLLKHRLGLSLRRLAQLIPDSVSLREFLGLSSCEEAPKRTTLQENVTKIRPETYGRILQGLVKSPEALEHEKGEKVRADATVVATNIHHPTDSSLMWDSLRVLTRSLKRAQRRWGVAFSDATKRAKKLRKKINFARNQVQRLPFYRRLLETMDRVFDDVRDTLVALRQRRSTKDEAARKALIARLEEHQRLGLRVMDQAYRRIVKDEKVPVQEKLLSVFEPHTDIIIKRRNHPEYGHKVTLTTGASGLVLDCVVEGGNPADATLTIRQLERLRDLYGRPPRRAAFDGGYASRENLEQAKAMGVERCAFSKASYLTPEEMAGSRRTYGRLKNFRAGIEGNISTLKQSYGLTRCTWKGWRRFLSYVWSSVLTFNLTKLARLRLRAK
jgi:transposase, IS5 family